MRLVGMSFYISMVIYPDRRIGLPHVHILLRVHNGPEDDDTDAIDRLVSAEVSSASHKVAPLVAQFMQHTSHRRSEK